MRWSWPAKSGSSPSRPLSCSAATPTLKSGDDETRDVAEACIDAAEQHDLVFHFHTSPGGASDINNFRPLIEAYGKKIKMYLVHFGGGSERPYQAGTPVPRLD